MVVTEIPISSAAAHFEQENEIFGQSFIFEFEWIDQESGWLLHIFDDSRNPAALGIKLQPQWPLYTHHIGLDGIVFILIPTKPGPNLERHTLKTDFLLVAYEII